MAKDTKMSNITEYTLNEIREQLDATPLLSLSEFLATDHQDLTQTSSTGALLERSLTERDTLVDYFHYLCMLGRFAPIRDYLEQMKQQYPEEGLDWILNNRSIYHHWFHTPLHTLSCWNNTPKLSRYLVQQGADPQLLDYYDHRPGSDMMGSLYVCPFRLGIPLDEVPYERLPYRRPACFQENNTYLASLL